MNQTSPRKRGRPRKNDQNPAAPSVQTNVPFVKPNRIVPPGAALRIEDAQTLVYDKASAHAEETILMFVEAMQAGRADMAAGRPITRQSLEAGKVLLGILDARPGGSPDKPMSEWSIAELEGFLGDIKRKRADAAKPVLENEQAFGMFE